MPRSPRPAALLPLFCAALAGLALTSCGALRDDAPDAADTANPAGPGLTGSVWVANEGSDTLSVLDAGAGTVRTTVAGIPAPHNVQVGTDPRHVWVTSGAGAVVGLRAHTLALAGAAATGPHPAHVVDDAAGSVYVTSAGDGALTRYDRRLVLADSTVLGGGPHGMRLDGDASRAVVANTGRGTLDVVDTATGEVDRRIRVGPAPVQVAVDPGGSVAYASVAGTRSLVRVDLDRGRVTGRLRLPAAPAQVLLTPADEVLVANQGTERRPGRSVSVVDAETMRAVAEIPTGDGPHGLTTDGSGARAWVTNAFDDTVTVLDLRSRTATGTVSVGDSPNGISFSPRTTPAGVGGVDLHLPPQLALEGGHSHDHAGDVDAGHDHG